jgi:hypothetical protein
MLRSKIVLVGLEVFACNVASFYPCDCVVCRYSLSFVAGGSVTENSWFPEFAGFDDYSFAFDGVAFVAVVIQKFS